MRKAIEYSFYLSDLPGSGKENCNISIGYALKGLIGNFPDAELKVANHHNLERYPHIVASLSHTQNIGAALLAPMEKYPSVGIDIEFKDRLITKGAEKYFFNEHDRTDSDILMTWTLKEAAFKALSPIISKFKWKKVLLLKDIWIKGDKFGLMGRKRVLGSLVCHERNLGEKKVLVSLAFLKRL